MKIRDLIWAALAALLLGAGASAGGWVEFNEQTALRLVTDDPAVGAADTQEKDYAWGDLDRDGDMDLVPCARTPGPLPADGATCSS
jgi:hypothetical protein